MSSYKEQSFYVWKVSARQGARHLTSNWSDASTLVMENIPQSGWFQVFIPDKTSWKTETSETIETTLKHRNSNSNSNSNNNNNNNINQEFRFDLQMNLVLASYCAGQLSNTQQSEKYGIQRQLHCIVDLGSKAGQWPDPDHKNPLKHGLTPKKN